MLFRHRREFVWAIAAIGAALSLYRFQMERWRESHDFALEVRTAAHDRAESIRRELDLNLSALSGLAAFLETGRLDRQSFDVVAAQLMAGHPSVRALEWSSRVPIAARPRFEARHHPIVEGNPAKPREARRRPEYFPVTFIYPINRNRTAFGFDLASSPGCRDAMERAEVTGAPAVTEKYPILEQTRDGFGVLAFLPVRASGQGESKETLAGFAAAVLQVADLAERGLQRFETSRLDLFVFDRDAAGPKRVLYAHGREALAVRGEADVAARSSVTIPMNVAGRRWAFVFVPRPELLAREHGWRPWRALILTLTVFAGVVLYAATNQRHNRRVQGLLTKVELANAELSKTRDEALEALKAKSLFLANLSHEVRTPLNGVLGMTELVLASPLTPEQRELLEVSQQSGRNLLMLLNDVLDYAKGVANKLPVESIVFDVRQELDPMFKLYSSSAESKGLEFGFTWDKSVPQWIRGDPTRLRQIVANLVSNSLKFTERGHIFVNLWAEEEEGGSLHLVGTVEDTGIGISGEALPNICSPFVQADGSTTRKYGGTGLGLAITKQLVTLMHGGISVRSKPGEGSLFTFRIQVERAEVPAAAASADPEYAYRRGARVLLAEDNEVNRRLLTRMLERLGCVVEAVDNGSDAVERYCPGAHDLVLMDCQMPGVDGYDAAEQIRARYNGAGAPVIAVTADASPENRERCHAAGMNDYVTKPASISILIDVLNRWVPQDDPVRAG